jgi:hypothetical protein
VEQDKLSDHGGGYRNLFSKPTLPGEAQKKYETPNLAAEEGPMSPRLSRELAWLRILVRMADCIFQKLGLEELPTLAMRPGTGNGRRSWSARGSVRSGHSADSRPRAGKNFSVCWVLLVPDDLPGLQGVLGSAGAGCCTLAWS